MKLHGNAALSLNKRKLLAGRVVKQGWSTARKWARRYRAEGEAGLLDRSSAARRVHNRTPEERIGAICALRRLRMTAAEMAEALGHPSRASLTRSGLGRLGRVGMEPACRYESSRPGELIHIDVKKLGRIGPNGAGHRVTGKKRSNPGYVDKAGRVRRRVGWEFVHVCVDDATRLAYVEVLGDEKARTAVAFLRRAIGFFERHGVHVERVLTDNGGAYRSTAHAIGAACSASATCAPRPRSSAHRQTTRRALTTL